MKTIDLTGKKFNFLTVVSQANSDKSGAAWNCVCECGKTTIVNSLKLRVGSTKSCGHFRAERIGLNSQTHGLSNKTKTYRTWKEMRQRCMNPNATQWKWYGERGISICERWSKYENFLADMGERPNGKSIDRISFDGNYEPSNCRWATPKQQAETNRGCFKKGHNNLRTIEKINGVAAK